MEGKRPRVALVLGAGSARGLAHIGVLQVLEENNIHVDMIVGSSIGAMVGSLYACGTNLRMLESLIENMNTSYLYDIRVPRMGFIAGRRIKEFLDLLTKKKSFADLNVPLFVVCCDLISGERFIWEEGVISEAVRASISIPGIFTPIKKDNMLLVDGAVTDRLPVEVARLKKADLVIAVDVTFGPGKKTVIHNTFDVILTTLDILQKQQFDIIYPKADILIQPAVTCFASQDFEKAREIIDMGREAAKNKLEEIKEKIFNFD